MSYERSYDCSMKYALVLTLLVAGCSKPFPESQTMRWGKGKHYTAVGNDAVMIERAYKRGGDLWVSLAIPYDIEVESIDSDRYVQTLPVADNMLDLRFDGLDSLSAFITFKQGDDTYVRQLRVDVEKGEPVLR